ncbi:hypothetical protein D3C77_639930 [compost metagenome]
MQPVDRFFIEQPDIVIISLYARHQPFIGVKAYGMLGESRDLGCLLDRMHVKSSLENKF